LLLAGFAILPIRAVLYTLSNNSVWLIGDANRQACDYPFAAAACPPPPGSRCLRNSASLG
jgi:hypothetical protein